MYLHIIIHIDTLRRWWVSIWSVNHLVCLLFSSALFSWAACAVESLFLNYVRMVGCPVLCFVKSHCTISARPVYHPPCPCANAKTTVNPFRYHMNLFLQNVVLWICLQDFVASDSCRLVMSRRWNLYRINRFRIKTLWFHGAGQCLILFDKVHIVKTSLFCTAFCSVCCSVTCSCITWNQALPGGHILSMSMYVRIRSAILDHFHLCNRSQVRNTGWQLGPVPSITIYIAVLFRHAMLWCSTSFFV